MSTRTTEHGNADDRGAVRLEASGSSPDEAMATLPGMYGGKHWHSTRTEGAYGYRYLAAGDRMLTLRRSQLRGRIRGEVHIGGDYVVHWLFRGAIVLDTLGDPRPLPRMRPNLSPDGEEFVFEAADYDARLVRIDRGLVRDVAGERAGSTLRSLQLAPRAAADPAGFAAWRDAVAAASAVVGARHPTALAWHEATRAVAGAFLDLYPPLDPPDHPALLYPRNARIRNAVDHIHANAARPMTVREIAAVAGLSIRSTQEGFQRVVGTSPMAYVHALRMDRVRAELLAADVRGTTVTVAARRWGFLHLGRFSAAYRARFGEFPRETLHR